MTPTKDNAAAAGSAKGRATADELQIEVYKQISEDFRQLNQVFWQAPVIIITVTGGIGVAVSAISISPTLRVFLLVFAALCNAAWVFVIYRLRNGVMEKILQQRQHFEEKYLPETDVDASKHRVMRIICGLLLMVAVGCVLAAIFQATLFVKEKKELPPPVVVNVPPPAASHGALPHATKPAIPLPPPAKCKTASELPRTAC